LKTFLILLFVSVLTTFFAQNNEMVQIDSNYRIDISLHHQIPGFNYFNEKIESGAFEQHIDYEGQDFTIQGGFKNFKADGLWVAFDPSGVPRLLEFFCSDTVLFLHLNDSLGLPAHHFTYRNNEPLNQEWYYKGRLIQFDDYSDTGRIVYSYHENMKPRLTFYVNEKGIAYKKIVYDNNGLFIKETYNMNE